MKILRGTALWLLSSIALYLCSVVVLWAMAILLSVAFENVWISGIAVTLLGEIIMLCCWFYRKNKRS